MTSSAMPEIRAGLEGVVAANTRISHMDGEKGELIIGGFRVDDLSELATYEESVYLLWYDRLPGPSTLDALKTTLRQRRTLSPITLHLLRQVAVGKRPGMDALRIAASTIGLEVGIEAASPEGSPSTRPGIAGPNCLKGLEIPAGIDVSAFEDALTLVATFPAVVAAYSRLLAGNEPLAPHPELDHVANYLYMLTGKEPTIEQVRGMETYFNTVIDHGFSASTFTARAITSTKTDLVSAIVGAVGALKGPLHGGAPGPALDMVFEIGSVDRADHYIREKVAKGDRLMGFGHRVYKVRDPRADVLSRATERLFRSDGDLQLYELARGVEKVAIEVLAELKPGRRLDTNVEFYTALLLHGLGLNTGDFTPTFAASRVAGWLAHCFEQIREGRLIRPQSYYTGPMDRRWVTLADRA